MMKELMYAGKRYVQDMELEDVAALKICLISLGALIGAAAPKRTRQGLACLAAVGFVGTCIPLVTRFVATLTQGDKQ